MKISSYLCNAGKIHKQFKLSVAFGCLLLGDYSRVGLRK